MLEVTEIYKSIQGESTYMGIPCVFVRLTGCNLHCVWCDTTHVFHGGKKLSIDQIFRLGSIIRHRPSRSNGGEPLLQKEVVWLIKSLLKNDFRVMLETGGSLSIKDVPAEVIKILDLKCLGSGEEDKNYWDNLNHLTPTDEIKFVISTNQS